jgi:hypothetical protein
METFWWPGEFSELPGSHSKYSHTFLVCHTIGSHKHIDSIYLSLKTLKREVPGSS